MYKTVPIFLNSPQILLIGGGKVAKQKAETLQKNSIDFVVISEDFILDFPDTNRIQRRFLESDLENFKVVVDATGCDEVGEILKRNPQILRNRVDTPKECDFFFSSNIVQGDLKIAVSTSGSSPRAGQIIRDRIEKFITPNFGEILKEFGKKREVKEINLVEVQKESEKALSKVYLIGAGTGDPELLTIKAYKTLQSLDTVFYDHLISKEILELIPESVEKISVGKQKGSHSKKQEEINIMLLHEVKKGKIVGRLKAGDPYIFGRGGEEALFLIENRVQVEVIPGISSSISFGLPPTHRGLASGFSVVSAHLNGNRVNLDWIPLLKMRNHTLVVLMGLSRIPEIVETALKIGVSKEVPVAIISNISRVEESRVFTNLENLEANSKGVPRPAILVFGDVVHLAEAL